MLQWNIHCHLSILQANIKAVQPLLSKRSKPPRAAHDCHLSGRKLSPIDPVTSLLTS